MTPKMTATVLRADTGDIAWSVDFPDPALSQCGDAPTLADAWACVRGAVREADLAADVAGSEAQLTMRGV